MELSWSTFVLEIVNFLALVWILKRFLYRPVLDVIAKRRSGVNKTLADAQALKTEAQALQDRYEHRLADWDTERQQARDALVRELEEERTARLTELRAVLEQERQKTQVADARRLADSERHAEQTALAHGARFATRLLEQTVGPDLQARLLELLLTELSTLPAKLLSGSNVAAAETIRVTSAFALTEAQRASLRDTLAKATNIEAPIEFDMDPALLAGVCVTIGPWVLGLNLRDELEGFARLAHGDG